MCVGQITSTSLFAQALSLHDVPERPDLDLPVSAHRGHQAPPLVHVHRLHAAAHVVELGVRLFAAGGEVTVIE